MSLQIVRLAASTIAAVAGIIAFSLIQWPAWAVSLANGSLRLPWQVDGWSEVLIDAQGRVGPSAHHSFLLATIALLLAATVTVACFDFLRPSADGMSDAASLRGVAAAGQPAGAGPNSEEINAEVVRLLQVVRGFIETNGLHGAALAKVNAQLPGIATPDQVKMVVSYLILENDNMRGRTRELSVSLENSKRQIEHLKGNLAVAKAEGLSDSLTSLKNRRAFDLALAGEMAASRKSGKALSVILADVDRFKSVNDRFGHPAGDELLRWLGKIFATNVKGRDTAARYGGEEFALILPQTSLSDATTVANQIRRQIEASLWIAPDGAKTRLTITASFGVAELREGESTDGLLRRVDIKLYEAKQAGRNKVIA